MRTNATAHPVLVTGGSGYIASWIVHQLLERHIPVHATVRDPDDTCRTRALVESARATGGQLTLFKANLLDPGSFDEAMAGCEWVIHTASPFRLDIPDNPYEALIRPAVEGTRHVLDCVNRTDTVRRVVLTSSVVALYGDAREIVEAPHGVFTEEMWNTTSDECHQPYAASKTLAEKEAWNIVQQQSRWDLITIHPGFVLGPARSLRTDSTSIRTMIDLGNGIYRRGIPELWLGVVDVRDVAAAHIAAGLSPRVHGRYIAVAQSLRLMDIVHILLDHSCTRYPLPRAQISKCLVWIMAPAVGFTRRYVRRNVGYRIGFDATRSRDELGIAYRPVRETVIAHFEQLIADGLIESP
ncbi:NAD-dependent epimerase/dehydratase family protein [bacterium]|nr:NAD-dependent epimerase/dehydratase family protein [candidate division CSSED10-310 bacterium]